MPNVRSTKVGLICSIKSSALRALRHVEVTIGCQYALLHRLSSKLCDISKGRAGKCTCCTCTQAALDAACVADSSIAPSLYRLPIVEKVMLRDDPIGNLVLTSPPEPVKLCLLTRHGHDELHAEMREGSQKCQRSRSEEMVLKFVD